MATTLTAVDAIVTSTVNGVTFREYRFGMLIDRDGQEIYLKTPVTYKAQDNIITFADSEDKRAVVDLDDVAALADFTALGTFLDTVNAKPV